MRPAAPHLSRRTRRRLCAATAVLSLAGWLFLAVAGAYTPLHAWLDGGTIADDDDCAIVAIAQGRIATTPCVIPLFAPVLGIEVAPRLEFSVFSKTIENLLSGRAPPALLAVS